MNPKSCILVQEQTSATNYHPVDMDVCTNVEWYQPINSSGRLVKGQYSVCWRMREITMEGTLGTAPCHLLQMWVNHWMHGWCIGDMQCHIDTTRKNLSLRKIVRNGWDVDCGLGLLRCHGTGEETINGMSSLEHAISCTTPLLVRVTFIFLSLIYCYCYY